MPGDLPPLRSEDVLGKRVYDVNGLFLGHATFARESAEKLSDFEVTLRRRVRRHLHADHPSLRVRADLIIDPEVEVSLSEDAEYLAHPERMPDPFYEADH